MTLPSLSPAPLYLVDASGFIFRAYHALPPLTRPDGTPVGAVMGFCSILMKLIQQNPDARIFIIFDAARANFRNEIYADYKANRDATPEDLIPQFPIIREAASAFGLPIFEQEGYEADDIIATYARLAKESGIQTVIVSSDKDLMQLVNDDVSMFDPMKQITIKAPEVFEKFGVMPERVVDVQALAGDASDNVPGVAGIGIKTAAQLITEYGDLETLLARAGEIKQPKRRETLIAEADKALISKRLVSLDKFVPNLPALNEVPPAQYNDIILREFLNAQGFKSLLNRMGQTSAAPPPSPEISTDKNLVIAEKPIDSVKGHYRLITDEKALDTFLSAAMQEPYLALDTETTGLTPAMADLIGISLSYKIGEAVYIPLSHDKPYDLLAPQNDSPALLSKDYVLKALKPILENPAIVKVGQNLKYDLQFFMKAGIAVTPFDDTMLMSYVLDGAQHGHGLDELCALHFNYKMTSYDEVTGTGKNRISFADVPLPIACDYAAEDADFTLRLYHHLKPRIATDKMSFMYEDVERPMITCVAKMEHTGIAVDAGLLKQLSHDFGTKIYALEQDIFKLVGHEFNVGSPKQLGHVLFEELGLTGGAKTKTGDWSTAVDVLEQLASDGHEIVQLILEWRHLSKLKSTYTEALQTAINPRTNRVHTSFSLAGTSTGRLSSSDPNLQNIPIRTEEGRAIRKAFVAKDGHVLISADYSQIELRLAAIMGDIKALKDAFIAGHDIHAATASQVFDIPLEQMTPDIRRKAKAINFGIIYGISGYGLGRQLDIDTGEAAAYIKQYFARFPELNDYMERTKEFARAHKYVVTHFGRKCFVNGIDDKNPARRQFAERQAINAPLQGTAADLMKLAMHAIDRRITRDALPLSLLLQVHDELIFEAPIADAPALANIIKEEMEKIADFSIPLIAETGIGKNWADAH